MLPIVDIDVIATTTSAILARGAYQFNSVIFTMTMAMHDFSWLRI